MPSIKVGVEVMLRPELLVAQATTPQTCADPTLATLLLDQEIQLGAEWARCREFRARVAHDA